MQWHDMHGWGMGWMWFLWLLILVVGIVVGWALASMRGTRAVAGEPGEAHDHGAGSPTAGETPAGEKVWAVPGISCGKCAARIRDALAGLDAVTDILVDVEGRKVAVRWDPGRGDPGGIEAKLEEAGYPPEG